MSRSGVERYAVAGVAFVAAATVLGVGLVDGLVCLAVFLVASQAVRAFQRRSDARTPAARERRPRTRPEAPAIERRPRPGVYDVDSVKLDWPAVGDAASW